MCVLAIIAKQDSTKCGLNLNKQLPSIKDVFLRMQSQSIGVSSPLKHRRLSNFISSTLLPSIHPSFPPSYYLLSDNITDWVGNKHFALKNRVKLIYCASWLCVCSHSVTVHRMDGSCCTLFLCMGPCGQLQQSAVMSHWYRASRRLSQWELMYQDGILSWLVWFKMEVQQRGQVNCGLFGQSETADPTETMKPQNETRGQLASCRNIFVLS